MNRHVRLQGSRYSFRLRLSNGYVEAHEVFDTEEDAAFAADLAKHYLRTFFSVTKNTDASLDGEVFCMLAHRHNVDLSDRLSVLSKLSPGVREYLDTHQSELAACEAARPERPAWEVLRASPLFNTSPAIAEWVKKCELAESEAQAFAEIDARSFITRFEVTRNALETALRSLRVAQRMHGGVTNPRLVERARIVAELLTHLEANEAYVRFLAVQFKDEEDAIKLALHALEASRPALT